MSSNRHSRGADDGGERGLDDRDRQLPARVPTPERVQGLSRSLPANEPMKASQSGTARSKALPTTTPSASSIRATEIPSSTEIVEAARIATQDHCYREFAHLYLLRKTRQLG